MTVLSREDIEQASYFAEYKGIDSFADWEELKPLFAAKFPNLTIGYDMVQAGEALMKVAIEDMAQYLDNTEGPE